jgi:chlorobactene glucosyltransferase
MLLVLLLMLGSAIVALCVQDVRREQRTPHLAARAPSAQPLVSVIVPARNEAARIGACLSGLASQTYRAFEVIVVDDDSSDGTAAVAQRYAADLPALHVLASAPLPPGWAGKCWACWQAAAHARGAWLLFLDADVAPQPQLIGALVARAVERRLAMITLMPWLQLGSLAERLALAAFQSVTYALYPLDRVSDPRAPVAFANGQCIFIRRNTYDAVGGHWAVRGEVLEDAIFGQHVKASGAPMEALAARSLLHVRMYDGWADLAEGLSKHAMAGLRNGGWRAAWAGVRQALLAFGPWYMLAAGVALRRTRHHEARALTWGGALLAGMVGGTYGWLFRRRYRVAWWWGMLYPLGLMIYFGLAGRAGLRMLRGQGVAWKGRVLRN